MLDSVRLTLKDNGVEKVFLIKKMSAFKAENWLIRAGLLIGKNFGVNSELGGSDGLLKAVCSVDYEKAMPLLVELMDDVYYVNGELQKRVADSPELIESPVTLLKLRIESAKANFGFLADGDTLSSLFAISTK